MSNGKSMRRKMGAWDRNRKGRPHHHHRPLALRHDQGDARPGLLVYDECAHSIAARCAMVEAAGGDFLVAFADPEQVKLFTYTNVCEPECDVDHREPAGDIFRQSIGLLMSGRIRAWRSAGFPFEGAGRWATPTVDSGLLGRMFPPGH